MFPGNDLTAPWGPAGSGRGPLYRAIQAQIMQGLATGEWKPGEALPPEPRLAQRFGVSIGTVRKAIDALVDANLLIRQQGRGTFVTTHSPGRSLYHFFNIVGPDGIKRYPSSELISFGRERATHAVADVLRLERGASVFHIVNRLSLDGTALMVDDLYVSSSRFHGLTRDEFGKRPSTIYALYQSAYGITVVRTTERLRARPAEAEIAGLLGIGPGAALLEIHRIAYSYDDSPVELRISRVNTARHDYLNTLV